MHAEPIEPLLKEKDIMRILGVHRPWILYARKERGLPYFKLGGAVRYRRSEVEAWIDQQRGATE